MIRDDEEEEEELMKNKIDQQRMNDQS